MSKSIITTNDLTIKDKSSLPTGNVRRKYSKKKKKSKGFKLSKNKYKAGV